MGRLEGSGEGEEERFRQREQCMKGSVTGPRTGEGRVEKELVWLMQKKRDGRRVLRSWKYGLSWWRSG